MRCESAQGFWVFPNLVVFQIANNVHVTNMLCRVASEIGNERPNKHSKLHQSPTGEVVRFNVYSYKTGSFVGYSQLSSDAYRNTKQPNL